MVFVLKILSFLAPYSTWTINWGDWTVDILNYSSTNARNKKKLGFIILIFCSVVLRIQSRTKVFFPVWDYILNFRHLKKINSNTTTMDYFCTKSENILLYYTLMEAITYFLTLTLVIPTPQQTSKFTLKKKT